MAFRSYILILLIFTTVFSNATELKKDGWNLMAVCQDMDSSEIDMTGLTEVQSQSGESIYSGEDAEFSDLTQLYAGYGYWVKGSIGTQFDGGEATSRIEKPLLKNGWNLMAICENMSSSDINMTGFTEVQSQSGESIYSGEDAEFSDLTQLYAGYGYWVKGNKGTNFISKKGISIPPSYTHSVINSSGEEVSIQQDSMNIKLFSDVSMTPNEQTAHAKVVIYINGQDLPYLNVMETYRGKNIVVAVYDNEQLIYVSDITTVFSEGVTKIYLTIDGLENPNTPPEISGTPPTTVEVGQLYSFTPNATDVDGDTLTFSIDTKPSWLEFNTTTGQLYGIPTSVDIGTTAQMTISVSDGEATASLIPFAIQVTAANQAPSVTVTGGDPTVTVGTTLSFDTIVDDPDQLSGFSYHWRVERDGGGIITELDTQVFSYQFNEEGTFIVTAEVTDDHGATGSDSVAVTVESACVMPQLPDGFDFVAINNLGVELQTNINIEGVGYIVKLYSNQEIIRDDQANHVGIVVNVNGVSTPIMQIQNDYRGEQLVAAIYNQNGELVAVSDIRTVDLESSITLIEMNADLTGGCGNTSNNVDIWFGSDVSSEEYDAAIGSDPSVLAGMTTYDLGYGSCEGVEAWKNTFSTSTVSSQRGELDETGSWNWIDDWDAMFTISGNELLVDDHGDGTDDIALKYLGSTTDPDEINSHIGHTMFASGVVAYKAISKRLTTGLEFDQEDESRYVKTHGNTDGVYYTSIASFIENQQGNRYFMGNDMEGIAFAEGSDLSAGSGTLVEVDNSGNIIDANAGTWNFNDGPLDGDESYISTFRLEVRPSDIQKYHDRIYAEFSHATYGSVVIEGDYEKVGTGYEMIWFNETGLNQFVSFIGNEGLPLYGNCGSSSSTSGTATE